ncbi:DISARM system SNF2-like helicase DrmD [Microbacterium sp. zg.Y1090]|uniref:DISARM system SNF2-like helicase DrmD n=1 Tax=Microbacterium wangruii TaxID=3049073 RepID=UPI00214C38F2|nr:MULTISPECIES: DISARM system SNF2-like helicase DrmD [unclassified Microbacterium]MCR2817310.1 DISARM system SNF2-like helicase DrmD [Microbacterium sp. zg.Y1090]WIM29202.1 DISARM system SNF2-like helicase DrmD [Microbacterium sp. zg-Y1090]
MSSRLIETRTRTTEVPEIGSLVNVRGARWSVTDVTAQSLPRSSADDGRAELQHAVTMQSVEEDFYGRELTVIWELEPGRGVIHEQGLPTTLRPDQFDDPTTFAAYVDALRWGALTSADPKTLQAPFRSSASVEAYQLEPLRRAIDSPRANMLLADDVGLGKTIEAGLVIQELLLRHRARSVIVVCPAGLVIKWKEELRDKFGLDFEIVNTETMKTFRRSFGVHANPFRVYPRVIVSMSWLPSPRAERMLEEVYASVKDKRTAERRAFDILIVDEAHHVAPATPSRANADKARYAVDSQRTIAVRRLAELCEHRLFLSATPHNGYTESFTALLEMIDPQRFARGADLDEKALRQVAVRRLKRDLPDEGFRLREVRPLWFDPSGDEAEAYEKLIAFTRRRNAAVQQGRGKRASDLATVILKKRFFSSPVAFAGTAETYLEARGDEDVQLPDYDDILGDEASDEEEGRAEQPELEALRTAKRAQVPLGDEDVSDLRDLIAWGRRYDGRPDSKLEALLRLIEGELIVQGHGWGEERIVIFTEYVTTLEWLRDVLESRGLGGERLAIIDGSTDAETREEIRARFNAPPRDEPIRILLATDAAGEGIDLQTYCHRLVSFDIPFNPNRLEQRIGRIDRYGQNETPLVWHPRADKQNTSDYAKDNDLLARLASKITNSEHDGISANEIIAPDLQRELGFGDAPARKSQTDAGGQVINRVLQAEHTLGANLTRLAERLEGSRDRMHLHEGNLLRVLEEGLRISGQPRLIEVDDPREEARLFQVPPGVSRTWVSALAGLNTRLAPDVQRPITFDEQRARHRTDVVYAHLGHPLIQRAARELRGQVWTRTDHVRGVSAVIVDGLDQSFAAGVARLVLVGEGGTRLHEEVFLAGTRLSRRQELGMEKAEDLLASALDGTRLTRPSEQVLAKLASDWSTDSDTVDGIRSRVNAAVQRRAERLRGAVESDLLERRDAELATVEEIFARFRSTLESTLAAAEEARRSGEEMLFQLPEEKQQHDRDRTRIRTRLSHLDDELHTERDAVERRYRDVQAHTFVAALVFALTPEDAEKLESAGAR